MRKRIVIDGFEFEGAYSDVSDCENLNYFLEEKFNKFAIKEFMSRRHPELYPKHIGLLSDSDFNLSLVEWDFNHNSYDGYTERGWCASSVPNPAKYKANILEFFQAHDPEFYDFIKDRIL